MFLMVFIDLKTFKTLIPQKPFVFHVFMFLIDLKTLKTLKLQNPRFESCGIWIKNIKNINPPKGFWFYCF